MTSCPNCFEGKRDGYIVRVICMDKGQPSFKKLVTPKICNICPVSGMSPEKPQEAHTEPLIITPDGTLIYARTGWEPPPVPPGYHRLTSDDVWVLEPLNPLCKHLKLRVAEAGSCGYHRIARRCTLIDSYVGPRTCEACQKQGE